MSTAAALRVDAKSLRLKRLVRLIRDRAEGATLGQPFIGLENIEPETGRMIEGSAPEDEAGGGQATRFKAGDVLFGKLRPYLRKVHLALQPGRCTGEALVLRHRGELAPRFLFYSLIADHFISAVDASTFGSKMPRANWEFIGEQELWVPTRAAQQTIANFLDRKTAALDDLIAKKERLIELLQEKRQALITQAVTKGLDPSVPMKDSGVEWIGRIPRDWNAPLLRRLARVQGGLAKGQLPSGPVRRLPYLRVANVQDGYVDTSDMREVEVEAESWRRYALRRGDVLMNEGGDNDKLGRGCVWTGQIDPCLHQNHVFAVRTSTRLTPEWLALWTSSAPARTFFERHAKQSTNLASISSSNLLQLRVALPPVEVQLGVLSTLGQWLERHARSLAAVQRSVALLREYRQALITNAVTGQLDIPGAA